MSKFYGPSYERELQVTSAQGPSSVFDRKLLQDYIDLLGTNIRVFLPFLESDPPVTVLEVIDHGSLGHHFANLTALDEDPYHQGLMLAYRFNGADEGLSIADHADFTFGNGAADSAFSVGCWINAVTPVAAQGLITRIDSLAATNLEWELILDAAGKVNFVLYDDDAPAATIGRLYNTAISDSTWYFVVGTYDATEADTGINVYLATSTASSIAAVDDTANSAGAYVAMEDKAVITAIGFVADRGVGNAEWFDGSMWGPFVVAEELSSATINALFHQGKKLLGF